MRKLVFLAFCLVLISAPTWANIGYDGKVTPNLAGWGQAPESGCVSQDTVVDDVAAVDGKADYINDTTSAKTKWVVPSPPAFNALNGITVIARVKCTVDNFSSTATHPNLGFFTSEGQNYLTIGTDFIRIKYGSPATYAVDMTSYHIIRITWYKDSLGTGGTQHCKVYLDENSTPIMTYDAANTDTSPWNSPMFGAGSTTLSQELYFDYVLYDYTNDYAPGTQKVWIMSGPTYEVAGTNATVRWTTDVTSDSTVYYGTDPGNLSQSATDSNLVTDHVINLTGLTAGQKWYGKAVSAKAGWVSAESRVVRFDNNVTEITYGPNAVVIDPVPPATTYSVKIVWRTDKPSTDNTAYYRKAGETPFSTGTDTNNSTYHEVLFTGLDAETTYEFKAKTVDVVSSLYVESLIYAFFTNPNLLSNGSFETWYLLPVGDPLRDVCDSGYVPDSWWPWEIYKYEEQSTTSPDHVHVSRNRPPGAPTPEARDGANRASVDAGWRSSFGGIYQTLTVTPGYYQVSGWMAWWFEGASSSTIGIYAKDGEQVNPSTTITANVGIGAATVPVASTVGFRVPTVEEPVCTAFLLYKKATGLPDPPGPVYIYGDSFTYTGLTELSFTGVSGVDYLHSAGNDEEKGVKQAPLFWGGTGSPGDKWQDVYVKTAPGAQKDWAYGERIVNCTSGKLTVYCNLKSPSYGGQAYSHYDGLRVMEALEPIEITNVTVTKGVDPANPDTKVTISWDTSVATATFIEYGPTSSYGTTIQDATPVTNHSATLSGLTARALCYYHIKAPAAGGCPTGDYTGTFQTPIQFSNLLEGRAVNGSSYDYTINFDTDVDVQCEVHWGLTPSYGGTPVDAGDGPNHEAVITGILPGQTLYYQLWGNTTPDEAYQAVNKPAKDAGHSVVAPQITISNVVSEPDYATGNACTIKWKTDYDTTTNTVYYRVIGGGGWLTATEPGPGGVDHIVTLTGLTQSARYEYYVESSASGVVPARSPAAPGTLDFYMYGPTNGINNPGFETGRLDGWTPYEFTAETYDPEDEKCKDGQAAFPEVRSTGNWILPSISNPHGGSYSCGHQSDGYTKNGGVYQIFQPTGGSSYCTASAWALGYTDRWDLTKLVQDNSMVRIGVDPTGGTNYLSTDIVWSPWTCTNKWWHQIMVGFTPGSGKATLFIEGTQLYAIGRLLACWDDVALSTVTPVGMNIPTVTLPGNPCLAESTAKITWHTDIASTTQLRWDTDGPAYSNQTTQDPTLVNDHEVVITVNPDTLYYFQAESTAAGYTTQTSADRIFSSLPAADGLLNGSFEGISGHAQIWPWSLYEVDAKTFYGNPLLPDGEPIDGLVTGRPYGGTPWFASITCEPDGGSSFIGAASNNGPPRNGGMWQRIATTPSSVYGVTMRINAYQEGGSPGDTECWLGVDPTGGVDPAASSVQWTAGSSNKSWISLSNCFEATCDAATIFCHFKQWWQIDWHVNAIDKVALVEPVAGIDAVKKAANGAPVYIASAIVTAAFNVEAGGGSYMAQGFAIEESERFSGIRVTSATSVSPGDDVTMKGTVATVDGERIIQAGSVTVNSSDNTIPDPFSIANIDTGGGAYGAQGAVVNDALVDPPVMCVGANNVGILMTLRGKVTARQVIPNTYNSYFYVDDAYGNLDWGYETGLKDGSTDPGTSAPNIGIRCRPSSNIIGAPLSPPLVGSYVEVTGVVGVRQVDGINARYMWTKSWSAATFEVDPYEYVYYPQWNLLSLPGQPKESDPAVVFGSQDVIDGRLYRWDALGQGTLMYDLWAPDLFGAMNNSEGYWFNAAEEGTVSYEGYTESTLDRWISAPQGWKIMGMPFTHSTMWPDWKATNGTAMKTIYEASQHPEQANWMSSIGFFWDPAGQGTLDFGLEDDWAYTSQLDPWYGYWVMTNEHLGLVAPVGSYP